jgi:hypothetical protein
MPEAGWLLIAFLFCFFGMAWIALAMEVHWSQVFPTANAQASPFRLGQRLLGIAALLLSLNVCLLADRPSMAALVWVMLLAICAVLVAITLSFKPAWLRWVYPIKI